MKRIEVQIKEGNRITGFAPVTTDGLKEIVKILWEIGIATREGSIVDAITDELAAEEN